MDEWNFSFELQLSDAQLLLASEIWGDVSSSEFARAIARSHAAIDDAVIESDGKILRYYGSTSMVVDQDALTWIRGAITQFMPSILLNGLAEALKEIAGQQSGVLFVDEKSFLSTDIDFVVKHGKHALLNQFRSLCEENVNETA